MKILYFDDSRLGVLRNGDPQAGVVDVSRLMAGISHAGPHAGPHDLVSGLIARFADQRGRLKVAMKKDSTP